MCDTHGVLSVAPVTVQEESVPIYFLPFLDYGFLFLSFSFFSFSLYVMCVYVFLCVFTAGYLKQQANTHCW